MGFLDNLKKASNSDIHKDWINIDSKDLVDQAIESSKEKPVAFFKHSTRCGISVQVKTQLEEKWDLDQSELAFYYLDLLQERQISNYIAEQTNVIHQSPQLIIVKDGKVVYNNSHFSIKYEAVESLV
jgi:bacillithiol system protein YtxJ